MQTAAQNAQVAAHVPALHCEKRADTVRVFISLGLLLMTISTPAWPADRMQFWNLTGTTINKLYLAPSGTTQWGPNQCANDPDGAVEPDERLKLTGISPGHYAVKLTDAAGRTCLVKDVLVEAGAKYAFSLSEADLKECLK